MATKLTFIQPNKLATSRPDSILDLLLQSNPPFEAIIQNRASVQLFRCGNIELLE